jgi:glucosamine--fructose-6-phosphate aminotransferase (isomerizing)
MCGIIGYTGEKRAAPFLLGGLKKLEYRGYDSCGVAILDHGAITVKKDIGFLDNVGKKLNFSGLEGKVGVGHTRWATTGAITKENAHPLLDCNKRIAVVHNGIIENWTELKDSLVGHKFASDTDTEVLAHLIEDKLASGQDLKSAVSATFKQIKGSSSFVVLDRDSGDLIAVKKGSPLVLGLAEHGNFISSDVPSFVKHTNKVVYLYDGDQVQLNKKNYEITNLLGNNAKHDVSTVAFSFEDVEKGEYDHFMLKEIMEQPGIMKNLESSNFKLLTEASKLIKKAKTVYLVGAGTSFHVARLGSKAFRENGINAVPVQGQDIATYEKVIKPKDVFIIISQSGETADILGAMHCIKNKTIGIINSEGSALAKGVDLFIPMEAGPERAVASTKAFTLSAVYVTLLAFMAAGKKSKAINDLKLMNINMYNLLVPSVISAIDKAAQKLKDLESVYFLGRGIDFIIALEGALKMKEVAYIHAEAIDAATFKHGPLALVSENTYAIALVSEPMKDTLYNLQEMKARGGKIIGIANSNSDLFDMFIRTQEGGIFSFVMQTIILQLLAYKTSVLKGIDPDRPKNLAKSVTVK